MHIDIWEEVEKRIQHPAEACEYIGRLMERSRDKMFNALIPLEFTNPPGEVRAAIEAFCAECKQHFDLKAVYLEMNGFDINTDRWYFDLFSYDHLSKDGEDLDWLCDWQPIRYPDVTLTGLEAIQEIYAYYREKELWEKKNKADNEELATLLVMAKFCQLIDESLVGAPLEVPVYATAHDFTIVYRTAAAPGSGAPGQAAAQPSAN